MSSAVLPEVSDITTFGGTMANFAPPEDPTTDLDCLYVNRWFAQLAMLSFTLPRAWARCTVAGAVISGPVDGDHGAVWGNTSGLKPTAARTSAGLFTLTWAASYNDLQAVPESHAVSFKSVIVTAYNGATAVISAAAVTSANVVTVRTWTDAGVAADPSEFSVWVR